ncbi:hypothetical protein [Nodosilinea sp. P-1105]|uniref:hypothetical protein n=1 Tax=Nodosilinea sp. P-1105 TaxID=2546229 RepID=UPI00146BFEA9|nr:hypothetical protein [Nodosilinea sp. P-1105]NMF85551.1 hypothetical protein [Nodosilinea sp. P-1105]
MQKSNKELRKQNERLAEFGSATLRERIQNRWIVLQARHLLSPTAEVEAAVADFVEFLQEYGEI